MMMGMGMGMMKAGGYNKLSLTFQTPFLLSSSLSNNNKFVTYLTPQLLLLSNSYLLTSNTTSLKSTINPNNNNTTFTWDDFFYISRSDIDSSSSDLTAFSHKIDSCNRGSDKHHEFIPFVIEDQLVGYVHPGFIEHLKKFRDVFVFNQDNIHNDQFDKHVAINPIFRTPDERTSAVADVVKCLGEELIPGIRNELYPVSSSFGAPVCFSLERAAAPYFGIKAYGVHMNGYVERRGVKYLWLAKRSDTKPTYPGMLDHLVAGGLPHGISCAENIVKECEEEAGIPSSLSNEAVPVGAVSYMDIDGYRYKRDVLFCYDLKLPEDFVPSNQDGEVESFKLAHIRDVANVIQKTQFFKTNCNLVIIDFLFRHGYIRPDSYGYLKLLQSLRRGDCF